MSQYSDFDGKWYIIRHIFFDGGLFSFLKCFILQKIMVSLKMDDPVFALVQIKIAEETVLETVAVVLGDLKTTYFDWKKFIWTFILETIVSFQCYCCVKFWINSWFAFTHIAPFSHKLIKTIFSFHILLSIIFSNWQK